jgi:hypothetical protein
MAQGHISLSLDPGGMPPSLARSPWERRRRRSILRELLPVARLGAPPLTRIGGAPPSLAPGISSTLTPKGTATAAKT